MGGPGSLHRLLRGMLMQRAMKRDEFISAELTNHLFQSNCKKEIEVLSNSLKQNFSSFQLSPSAWTWLQLIFNVDGTMAYPRTLVGGCLVDCRR